MGQTQHLFVFRSFQKQILQKKLWASVGFKLGSLEWQLDQQNVEKVNCKILFLTGLQFKVL